jgi:cytoskeletal protein CcmA (bactofilin family)
MRNYTYFDEETTVQGELTTGSVIVEGSFDGQITAREKVLLKKSARLKATISARKLMIEEGAILNGTIRLHENGQ